MDLLVYFLVNLFLLNYNSLSVLLQAQPEIAGRDKEPNLAAQ